MHERNSLGKENDKNQSKGCLENRFTQVYWTIRMDRNGPKHSSNINWTGGLAQVPISWSDAKTVEPGPTDPRLFQSLNLMKTKCPRIGYRHLLWIPRTILDQNFDLKNQCAYYMRTKYPGFFSPHPANVLIASFDDKHTGYIDSMFSCFGIILILISSTVCLKY